MERKVGQMEGKGNEEIRIGRRMEGLCWGGKSGRAIKENMGGLKGRQWTCYGHAI